MCGWWVLHDLARFDSTPSSRHSMTASAKIIPNMPLFSYSPFIYLQHNKTSMSYPILSALVYHQTNVGSCSSQPGDNHGHQQPSPYLIHVSSPISPLIASTMTSYAYHPMLVGIVSVSARHWQRHLAKVAKYKRHNTPFCPPTIIRPSLLPGPLIGALVLSPQGYNCYTAVQSQLRKKYRSWPPFICNSLYKALGLRSVHKWVIKPLYLMLHP